MIETALRGLPERNFLELGKQTVAKIEGFSLNSWESVTEYMTEHGMDKWIQNRWPTLPLNFEKQRIFEMQTFKKIGGN